MSETIEEYKKMSVDYLLKLNEPNLSVLLKKFYAKKYFAVERKVIALIEKEENIYG